MQLELYPVTGDVHEGDVVGVAGAGVTELLKGEFDLVAKCRSLLATQCLGNDGIQLLPLGGRQKEGDICKRRSWIVYFVSNQAAMSEAERAALERSTMRSCFPLGVCCGPFRNG